MSENKARAIVLKYPTIRQLYEAYEKIPTCDRPSMLAELSVSSGIMQEGTKKIGQKLSEYIYTLLTSNDANF